MLIMNKAESVGHLFCPISLEAKYIYEFQINNQMLS